MGFGSFVSILYGFVYVSLSVYSFPLRAGIHTFSNYVLKLLHNLCCFVITVSLIVSEGKLI
jgi:hypothetical protein